jgi:hypothetical protein
MIQGNQTWQLALAQSQKQALYLLEIPDFAIAISSFPTSVLLAVVPGVPGAVPAAPTGGGYGVTLYGIGAYGT